MRKVSLVKYEGYIGICSGWELKFNEGVLYGHWSSEKIMNKYKDKLKNRPLNFFERIRLFFHFPLIFYKKLVEEELEAEK